MNKLVFAYKFDILRTPLVLLAYPQGYAYPRLRIAEISFCKTLNIFCKITTSKYPRFKITCSQNINEEYDDT